MNNVKMTSEKFFDYYGDCYISDTYMYPIQPRPVGRWSPS